MRHMVLCKRAGYYSAFPMPQLLPDGRLTVRAVCSPFVDHYAVGGFVFLVSEDGGETFHESDDRTFPLAWPAANGRELHDRFADKMPNNEYVTTGTGGLVLWPTWRKKEAEEMGLLVHPHPDGSTDHVIVGSRKLFVARSQDRGESWARQEWEVPGFARIMAMPRWTRLHDGRILVPVRGYLLGEKEAQLFVFRSDPQGDNWRLMPMTPIISELAADETCFVEVAPGRVLAHTRWQDPGYLLESWSEDGGLTWSQQMRTAIKGYPPHLLCLQDGRILCSYGYRWPPMGVRAVLSDDGGQTWDVEHTIILRADGGTVCSLRPDHEARRAGSDVGYPITVQLADGTLFTVYYITLEDGITHVAATKWRLDEVQCR